MKKFILSTLGVIWSILACAVVPYDPVMTQSPNCQQLQSLDKNLVYFLERVKVPYAFQLHLKSSSDFKHPKINGAAVKSYPVAKFLSNLP